MPTGIDLSELDVGNFVGPNYQVINVENAAEIRGKKIEVNVSAVDVPTNGEQVNVVARSKIDEEQPKVKIRTSIRAVEPIVSIESSDNIGVSRVELFYLKDKKWIRVYQREGNRLRYKLKIDSGQYLLKTVATDQVGNESQVFNKITILRRKTQFELWWEDLWKSISVFIKTISRSLKLII